MWLFTLSYIGQRLMQQYQKTISKHFKRANVLPRLYGKFFGHQDYTRFALVGYARTGSNFLAGGIESSDAVQVDHEIFAAHNREIGKDFDKILSRLYGKKNNNIQAVGFKLFYYHLTDQEWQKFLMRDEFRIIHLTRRNRLRTLVSLDIAFKTDQWTSGSVKRKSISKVIRLDPNTIVERIEEIERYENLTRERFKDRPFLEIVHEDVIENPTRQFRRIGEFLGITDFDPSKISIRKQNPESFHSLVENFDEISHILEKTRFASYLE